MQVSSITVLFIRTDCFPGEFPVFDPLDPGRDAVTMSGPLPPVHLQVHQSTSVRVQFLIFPDLGREPGLYKAHIRASLPDPIRVHLLAPAKHLLLRNICPISSQHTSAPRICAKPYWKRANRDLDIYLSSTAAPRIHDYRECRIRSSIRGRGGWDHRLS